MIRRATADDAEAIASIGAQFHALSPWALVPYDGAATAAFVRSLVDVGAVFLSDAGVIGGLITPLYFNPAIKTASELFWYAPSGEGQALRKAFEQWAEENGASFHTFGSLENENADRIDRFYRRNGFELIERAYRRPV